MDKLLDLKRDYNNSQSPFQCVHSSTSWAIHFPLQSRCLSLKRRCQKPVGVKFNRIRSQQACQRQCFCRQMFHAVCPIMHLLSPSSRWQCSTHFIEGEAEAQRGWLSEDHTVGKQHSWVSNPNLPKTLQNKGLQPRGGGSETPKRRKIRPKGWSSRWGRMGVDTGSSGVPVSAMLTPLVWPTVNEVDFEAWRPRFYYLLC